MKTVSKSITTGKQNVFYQEIIRLGIHRFKIFINSDSYDFQCEARIDKWSGKEWKLLHQILNGAMRTKPSLQSLPSVAKVKGHEARKGIPSPQLKELPLVNEFTDLFQQDRDELIRVALEFVE